MDYVNECGRNVCVLTRSELYKEINVVTVASENVNEEIA